jgi:hypothetical protein
VGEENTLAVIARSQMVDSEDVKVCLVASANVGWGYMDDIDASPALVFGARLCRFVESEVHS